MAPTDSPLARELQADLPPGVEMDKRYPIPRLADLLEVAPDLTPADPAEIMHFKQLLAHLSREQSLALATKVFDTLRPELEQLLDALDFEERDRSVFRLQNGPAAVAKCILLLSLYQVSEVLWVGLMAAVSLEAADEAGIITMPEPLDVDPFELVPAPSDPRFYCILCTQPFLQDEDVLGSTDSPESPFTPSVYEVVMPSENADGPSQAEVVSQDSDGIPLAADPSTDDSADSSEYPAVSPDVPTVAQTCCSHLFCIECLLHWVKVSASCPDCRELL